MRFTDGMEIQTNGDKLRVIRKSDGLYVVGQGLCIPVSDMEEAQEIIADIEATD